MFAKSQPISPEQAALLERVNKAEREIKMAKFKTHLKSPHWLFWMCFKYFTFLLASVAVLVPPYSVFITSFKTIDQYYDYQFLSYTLSGAISLTLITTLKLLILVI